MKKQIKLSILSGLMLLGFQAQAINASDKPIQLSINNSNNSENAAQRDAFGGPVFVIDDGNAENSIGDSGQFIWMNRFTPAVSDFPFQLEEVSVVFGDNLVNVGDDIEILVYEDTDNDGDPGTNAVLLASFAETIQFNDLTTFNVYTLSMPVELTGPGDVIVGIVNKSGSEGNADFPAAIDQDNSQGRSWVASYNAGNVPSNPQLPGDEQWGTIDSFGLPGNWMIRAAGSPSVPVELMNFTVE